jgi:hypothetical protein
MAIQAERNFGLRRRPFRTAFVTGAILAAWMLAACTGAPSITGPAGVASPSSDGEMRLSTPEVADAMGVYPPPPGAAAPADSKAMPHATGTNSVYLPAIINQKAPHYPFEVQQTGVLAVQGFFGCEWAAVAGQVFDRTGTPIQNLILHLEGFWDGNAVETEALSGSAEYYGPAGYEFVLGTRTLDTIQALWIQVLDGEHKQISPRVYFDTYDDCTRNLILINFVQVR